jgi:hypothetical protein
MDFAFSNPMGLLWQHSSPALVLAIASGLYPAIKAAVLIY